MVKQIKNACTNCGKCCQGIYIKSMPASQTDITRWEKEKRHDILSYVAVNNTSYQKGYYLWVKNGKELSKCPFLRKIKGKQTYRCNIYATRPKICREYPDVRGCLNVSTDRLAKTDPSTVRKVRRIITAKLQIKPDDCDKNTPPTIIYSCNICAHVFGDINALDDYRVASETKEQKKRNYVTCPNCNTTQDVSEEQYESLSSLFDYVDDDDQGYFEYHDVDNCGYTNYDLYTLFSSEKLSAKRMYTIRKRP